MPARRYGDDLTLAEARRRFFADNGFDARGGYASRFFWLGPRWLRVPVPNVAARVRAVRLHDCHHIAADFPTTWRGEAEIGAWELGGGCGRYWAAWLLDLAAVSVGLTRWPRASWRAFLRGRRSRNLYHHDAGEEEFLQAPLARLRVFLHDPAAPVAARPGDRAAFAGVVLAAAALAGTGLALAAGGGLLLWRLAAGGH